MRPRLVFTWMISVTAMANWRRNWSGGSMRPLNRKKPFFIAGGFIRPHLPFVAPQKYWDLYDASQVPMPTVTEPPAGAPSYAPQFGGELRNYADMPSQGPIDATQTRHLIHGYYAATSYMDASLGRVLDCLDRNRLWKTPSSSLGRSRLASWRSRHVVQTHQLRTSHPNTIHHCGTADGQQRQNASHDRNRRRVSNSLRPGRIADSAWTRWTKFRSRRPIAIGSGSRIRLACFIRETTCSAAPFATRVIVWSNGKILEAIRIKPSWNSTITPPTRTKRRIWPTSILRLSQPFASISPRSGSQTAIEEDL